MDKGGKGCPGPTWGNIHCVQHLSWLAQFIDTQSHTDMATHTPHILNTRIFTQGRVEKEVNS